MSQLNAVANFLKKNARRGAGVTTAQIAHAARMPRESVRKRVHDLRNEGYEIVSNARMVKGIRKTYYRLFA